MELNLQGKFNIAIMSNELLVQICKTADLGYCEKVNQMLSNVFYHHNRVLLNILSCQNNTISIIYDFFKVSADGYK